MDICACSCQHLLCIINELIIISFACARASPQKTAKTISANSTNNNHVTVIKTTSVQSIAGDASAPATPNVAAAATCSSTVADAKTSAISPTTSVDSSKAKVTETDTKPSADDAVALDTSTANDAKSTSVAGDAKLRLENERLARELQRMKRLFECADDFGAVGGTPIPTPGGEAAAGMSETCSLDAHSTDGSSSRVERLETELKMAREQISRKDFS